MSKWSILLFSALLVGCAEPEKQESLEPEMEAKAKIYSIAEDEIQDPGSSYLRYVPSQQEIGVAYFSQSGNVVSLTIELKNQEPGSSRAVHIHDGSLSQPLRHWNQQSFERFCNKRSLGQVWAKVFAGDVGNVPIDEDGKGMLSIQTDFWALNSGDEKDILDKIIIVHEEPEDFAEECDPAHDHSHMHSNRKIGGGIIELVTNVDRNVSVIGAFESPDFTVCK